VGETVGAAGGDPAGDGETVSAGVTDLEGEDAGVAGSPEQAASSVARTSTAGRYLKLTTES
jgi:hypothetical protein